MKKHIIISILSAGLSTGLLFSGCGNTMSPNLQEESTIETSISKHSDSPDVSMETSENIDIVQNGPYGELSLTIPVGWNYETYPIDSGQSAIGMYGIFFYPEGVSGGYIELTYTNSFGVCGTGLREEMATIAGHPASIGTYDNHTYWDFVSFREDYSGIVALTFFVDGWWETYSEQIMDILNTLSFDPSVKEGGVYIHSAACTGRL